MTTFVPTRFHTSPTTVTTGLDPETLTFSAFTKAKAARFIEQGRVQKVADQRDLWEVAGDHGTYRVRYDRWFEETGKLGFLVCTCPLSEHHNGLVAYCSHALAVLTLAATPIGATA